MAKGRARLQRKIQELEQQLESERQKADRYKKRHQCEMKQSAVKAPLTPRSKTRRLLRYMKVSNDVRKTVLFHNVVIQNLQEKYVGLKSRCAKKNFQNFFESQTLKKYKMLTMCRSAFGFSVKNRGTPAKLMSKTTDFCTI